MSKNPSPRDVVIVLALVGSAFMFLFAVWRYDLIYWQACFLLLILPFLAYRMYQRRPSSNPVQVSTPPLKKGFKWRRYNWMLPIEDGVLILLITLCILLASGPVKPNAYEQNQRDGIDIMLVMDLSLSMLAQDFTPNRLESAKRVAQNFVGARPDDRFGLVIYEAESFTQVPLTTDHKIMKDALGNLETGFLEGGTAIGMGLATAVNGLRNSAGKSKVIILLTDGENNAGQIEPLDAARLAQSFGIYVHTIGVGSRGVAKSPTWKDAFGNVRYQNVSVNIDEETLMKIAEMTEGSYSRAESSGKLSSVFEKIDKLEKTRFDTNRLNRHLHKYSGLIALVLLLLASLGIWKYLAIKTTP